MVYLQNELRNISQRLYNEKICLQPLDERSLSIILRYMGSSEPCSELMRRLSDIEINSEQILIHSERSTTEIKNSVDTCAIIFKDLIDRWNSNKLTESYSFSISKADIDEMYLEYCKSTEAISAEIGIINQSIERLGENAALIKGCGASFLEVDRETRFAYYAAALNGDAEGMVSCKAVSMQARDSANESNKRAADYLSALRAGDRAVSVIKNTLSDSTSLFDSLLTQAAGGTTAIVNTLIRGINSLKNIYSSIK